MKIYLLLAAAYLLGSIPFGLVLGLALKGVDLRSVGSGNIGAANAFRTLGPLGGLLVLSLDASKGWLPVFLAASPTFGPAPGGVPVWQVLIGMAAIVGHNNSLYLGFKGGKGIATSLGVAVAISWQASLVCLAVWGVAILVTRYASVASLCGVTAFPAAVWYFFPEDGLGPLQARYVYLAFGLIVVLFAFYKHRKNLQNLWSGTELKLGRKPDTEA